MTQITYKYGDERCEIEVDDERAGWNPSLAEQYAQTDAVRRFGFEIDVNDVRVTLMGRPDSEYDETWGM